MTELRFTNRVAYQEPDIFIVDAYGINYVDLIMDIRDADSAFYFPGVSTDEVGAPFTNEERQALANACADYLEVDKGSWYQFNQDLFDQKFVPKGRTGQIQTTVPITNDNFQYVCVQISHRYWTLEPLNKINDYIEGLLTTVNNIVLTLVKDALTPAMKPHFLKLVEIYVQREMGFIEDADYNHDPNM